MTSLAPPTTPGGASDHSLSLSERDPFASHRAHILSPITPRHTSPPHSIRSSLSDHDLPSLRQFRRAHFWVQFPISLALPVGLAITLFFVTPNPCPRWADLALGAAGFLVTESLKEKVFEWLTWEKRDKEGVTIKGSGRGVPTIVHGILQESIRLGFILICVALLPEPVTTILVKAMPPPPSSPSRPHPPPHRQPLPPIDTLFFSALWISLGWASVEILWASADFYRRMKLYDDVLPGGLVLDDFYEHDEESDTSSAYLEPSAYTPLTSSQHNIKDYGSTPMATRSALMSPPLAPEDKLSRSVTMLEPLDGGRSAEVESRREEEEEDELELDVLMRRVERLEVEAQMGVPLWEIPVAVVIVWRIDAILLSLNLTLLLSLPFRTTSPTLVPFPFLPTFIFACCLHVFLSLLWVMRIPHVGLPSLSYSTLVVTTMTLFGVLGAWGALE